MHLQFESYVCQFHPEEKDRQAIVKREVPQAAASIMLAVYPGTPIHAADYRRRYAGSAASWSGDHARLPLLTSSDCCEPALLASVI